MAGKLRSLRTAAGSIILLLGVPAAIVGSMAFGDIASAVIHVALGASFFLLAFSVFDFRTPAWITWPACISIAVLAAVFSLQAGADISRNAEVSHFAYAVLGQTLERWLGYAFLAWCVALLIFDCNGVTRIIGVLALAIVACVEVYVAITPASGLTELAKLAYLPVFVWLLLEGSKRRA